MDKRTKDGEVSIGFELMRGVVSKNREKKSLSRTSRTPNDNLVVVSEEVIKLITIKRSGIIEIEVIETRKKNKGTINCKWKKDKNIHNN